MKTKAYKKSRVSRKVKVGIISLVILLGTINAACSHYFSALIFTNTLMIDDAGFARITQG